ncbi:hypothetical protein [Rivihabitans pingtungensis]|uniref:hypothetical protein n=1 Tax=Rivihabitans pingtungensis TaxID=1054498 RepID=UPI002356DC00|nr:hypothetical protein [Rivihabitans pingtungensis]MCK6435717.1 hypothetical protein [Rivihabitans pingtungensis]
MRIVNTDITMQSERRASQSSRTLTVRREASLPPRQPAAAPSQTRQEPVTLSAEGKRLAEQARQQIQAGNAKTPAVADDAANLLSPSLTVLRSILEKFFGVKVELFNPRELTRGQGADAAVNTPASTDANQGQLAELTIEPLPQSFVETTTTRYRESESMNWQANGVVQTADGQTLNFDLSLALSRSAQWDETHTRTISPRTKDPLVINFAGPAAQLGAGQRTLDLDQDGQSETFSMLASGSGFLALDKDGDGKVSDGGELFGTQSGNGFADLAQYDEDGNGWIDEGDTAFAQLKIWAQDEHGQDQLLSLTEAGVGALFLGSQSTEFSLKDNQQQLQGQVRQTGVFLRENGTAGTLQQIDLAV